MEHSETYKTKYKCGHYAAMPPYVTTPEDAKNYARWAKGQGLCLTCHSWLKAAKGQCDAHRRGCAELVGSVKQVRWALAIRQEKLQELDLAVRYATALREHERSERLKLAQDKLIRSTKAETWIVARELSVGDLVESCLGASV